MRPKVLLRAVVRRGRRRREMAGFARENISVIFVRKIVKGKGPGALIAVIFSTSSSRLSLSLSKNDTKSRIKLHSHIP